MDISSLPSGASSGFGSLRLSSQMRTMQMVSTLLPAASKSPSGIGLGQDMYSAVASQTQGLYAGGRAAMNSAYAALGIDMSQSTTRKEVAEAVDEATVEEKPEAMPEPRKTRNITDELLKEAGYVKPESDPYVVRTDFFA
jgi:hypothetical protein